MAKLPVILNHSILGGKVIWHTQPKLWGVRVPSAYNGLAALWLSRIAPLQCSLRQITLTTTVVVVILVNGIVAGFDRESARNNRHSYTTQHDLASIATS